LPVFFSFLLRAGCVSFALSCCYTTIMPYSHTRKETS
jgi:hypothetical protein